MSEHELITRAAEQHGVVTLEQARAHGLSEQVEACIDQAIRARITTLTRGSLSQSRLEAAFLTSIRSSRLPRPTPQLVVQSYGHFVARVDFAWPPQRLLVELDGAAFHASRRDWSRDLQRQNTLTALGYTILRFTWWDVHERHQDMLTLIERSMKSDNVVMLDPHNEAS